MIQTENQRGVAFFLFAAIIPVAIVFLALVMNIGYLYLTKIELEFVTESAAHAGAVGLHQGHDEVDINSEAEDYINSNPVLGDVVNSSEYTIDIGSWEPSTGTFTVTGAGPSANAVRIETTITRNYLFDGYLSATSFTLTKSVIAVISTTSEDYTITIIDD